MTTLPGPHDIDPEGDCRAARDPHPARMIVGGVMPAEGQTDVDVSYAIGLLGRGILSVVFDGSSFRAPAAHGIDVYAGVIIDIETGAEVPPLDLFDPATPWRPSLLAAAIDWARQRLRDRAPSKIDKFGGVYLKEGSIVLLDVASGAARAMQIPVPLTRVRASLRPEWERRLLGPDMKE